MGLFDKQQGVNPRKSMVGCLLTNALLLLITGAILYFAGIPFRAVEDTASEPVTQPKKSVVSTPVE